MRVTYTLPEILSIRDNGINNFLDERALAIINEIASLVGAVGYIKTPNFPRHDKRRNNESVNTDDWEHIRTFKATELKQKEGSEKIIDDINKILNKITDRTYDSCKTEIIDKLKLTVDDPNLKSDVHKIGTCIFKVASCNKFFSLLYAQLYKDLIISFDFMNEIFEKNYTEISKEFEHIEVCLSSENYDKLCENNKKNDNRKSLCQFYVNLMLKGIISANQLLDIITLVQTKFSALLATENNTEIVEEFSELLYIFLSQSYKYVKKSGDIETINGYQKVLDVVIIISESNKKSFPSISNKIIFRQMDILDDLRDVL